MNIFAHLFLPQRSNNYRSKLLHHHILLFFIAILFVGSFISVQVKRSYPEVFGISTNITNEQLLLLVNEERQRNGQQLLKLSPSLNIAAERKAEDMFASNYWAHVSPSGTTPWFFIKDAGYEYVYAGENLAKGFSSAEEAVDAWMASSQHRENALSSNYQDVGFAVRTGKLQGEDTVLIVQEFGGKVLMATTPTTSGVEIVSAPVSTSVQAATLVKPYINSLLFSSNIYIGIISLFILVLVLDMFIVKKHKIIRIAGHNMDHILFFITFLLAGFLIAKGVVI
ncbi:MAG: CAP domain-containing protein [Candidatus Levyibacteriota bacterium]